MSLIKNRKKAGFLREFYTNHQLYLMALPAVVWFFIFSYYPLLWLQIAFKDYNIVDGVWKSPWIGFNNLKFYFQSQYFFSTTFNTLYLNTLFIITMMVAAVTLAILLNEVRERTLKKIYQSALFLPYFLSWIVISAFLYNILGESYGTINTMLKGIGLEPVAWYSTPALWPFILVFLNTWQGVGYNVVIYLGAIVSIDSGLYEAANIDGASRFQQIRYVTIPHLVPTIIILLLLAVGKIFYGNFQMIYSVVGDNGTLIRATDIIDTYIFRAMNVNGTYGEAAAIGVYQSVIGFIVVVLANKLAKRADQSMGLF